MRTRNLLLALATLIAATGTWTAASASPPKATNATRYVVTVTNITKGQILGPIVVSSHSDRTRLFELGEPASVELAHLAEEGDPSLLVGALTANPEALITRTNGAVTLPGDSSSIVIAVDDDHTYLSLASMLVSTNDAFIGLRDIPAPTLEGTFFARVYDAGSEFNSEDCGFVPGPPCGSAGMHDPTPAEGYVRIHEGIHGIASLAPEEFDWRGEAAEVTIRRLNP